MKYIRTIPELIENWQLIQNTDNMSGFFLYDRDNKKIINLIRTRLEPLINLTRGKRPPSPDIGMLMPKYETNLVFLIERPVTGSSKEVEEYWNNFDFGDYQNYVDQELKEVMPYDKETTILIANHFHIPQKLLPCIVFFDKMHPSEIVVIKIGKAGQDDEFEQLYEVINSAFHGSHEKLESFVEWFNEEFGVDNWAKRIELPRSIKEMILELFNLLG